MKRSLLLTLLVPVVLAGPIHAASDYFLKIDGIKGESKDETHAGTIEITSFSWGTTNTPAAAGSGSGKVSFQDMHFVTELSKASPQLLIACAGSSNILSATLYARNPANTNQEYYQIKMENVLVSSYSQGGHASASTNSTPRPTEEISLNFDKITVTYTEENGTVTAGSAVRSSAP